MPKQKQNGTKIKATYQRRKNEFPRYMHVARYLLYQFLFGRFVVPSQEVKEYLNCAYKPLSNVMSEKFMNFVELDGPRGKRTIKLNDDFELKNFYQESRYRGPKFNIHFEDLDFAICTQDELSTAINKHCDEFKNDIFCQLLQSSPQYHWAIITFLNFIEHHPLNEFFKTSPALYREARDAVKILNFSSTIFDDDVSELPQLITLFEQNDQPIESECLMMRNTRIEEYALLQHGLMLDIKPMTTVVENEELFKFPIDPFQSEPIQINRNTSAGSPLSPITDSQATEISQPLGWPDGASLNDSLRSLQSLAAMEQSAAKFKSYAQLPCLFFNSSSNDVVTVFDNLNHKVFTPRNK